jgi:ribosomal protein L11 methyltransferase
MVRQDRHVGGRAPVARTRPRRRRPTGRPRRTQARWLEAAIRVPAATADRVGTLLVECGSQGVITGVRELTRGARAHSRETVRGFFPSAEPIRARLAVRAALGGAGDPALARAPVRWRELDAQLWEMDWREHFQPVRAGRSLVVVPPWNRTPHPGRRRVVIHPGMAFGTGQHATTLACLEAIERLATPPPRTALDVGTGTGVLAIALAKLGVTRVVALDTDPQAITAARANVRRNGVGARVRLARRALANDSATAADGRRDARRPSGERFPLVVANLYVDVLVALEPTLAARVTEGGRLITSGVLRTQQGRLRATFAPARWRMRSAGRRGPWVTTIFERRA